MERKFSFIIRITLVALYLVFLAGSVVRMTGSGMGCPDWPKCFGKLIPPTDINQLPTNYKEKFAQQRKLKIDRFAKLLNAVGLTQSANALINDKSLLEEEDFNAAKTWTEYVNRLVGAISGILILIGLYYSIRLYRTNSNWVWICFLNLILIVITGWFGAVVVATNLMPWVLTVHMSLGLLLIFSQINLLTSVIRPRFKIKVSGSFRFFLAVLTFLILAQILLGTQVRQEIDDIAKNTGEEFRYEWINHTDIYFLIHRSFSILITLLYLLLMYSNLKNKNGISLLNLAFLILIIEILFGVSLNYLGFPAISQPFHLMTGCILLGLQYYIFKRTSLR